MILGLAGKSGSGKNALAGYLEGKGFKHYDLDIWAHKGLDDNKEKLLEVFGSSVLDSEGQIDRKALGERIFSSPDLRQSLQDVLYPWLEKRILQETAQQKRAVLNGALLSESSLQKYCDAVLWVQAPFLIRLYRLCKRDHHSLRRIWKRLNSQRFLSSQLFLPEVDIHIVKNHRSLQASYRQIDRILKILNKKG